MPVFVQILLLLLQIFPEALKAIKAWQEYHGQKLTAENRAKLAADVKSAVQTAVANKNTAGLEDMIKNLGKPSAIPKSDVAPSSQNPS